MTTTSSPADRVERRREQLERLLQITSHAYDLRLAFGGRDGLDADGVLLGLSEAEVASAEYLTLKGRALHLLGHYLTDLRPAAEQAGAHEGAGAAGFARWWHALEDARLENQMTRRWPGMAKAFTAKLPPNLGGTLLARMSAEHQVEMGLYLEGRRVPGGSLSDPVRQALDDAARDIRRGAEGESPQDSLEALMAIYPRLRRFARRKAGPVEQTHDGGAPVDGVPAADSLDGAPEPSERGTPEIEVDDGLVWARPLGRQRHLPEWYRPGSAPWFERGATGKRVHPSVRQTDRQTIVRPPRGEADTYRELWIEVEREAGYLVTRLIRCLQETTYLRYAGRYRSGKLAMSKLWRQRLADYRLFQRRESRGRQQLAFSILVDESASMGGRDKSKTAAKAAVLLGECLSRLEAPFEIIGFTTADYEARCAMRLGLTPAYEYRTMRCARLEHRLYKTFDEPFRPVRTRLAGIQPRHNNWDEEHLLFAHRRLVRRREPAKVMIVISDGQPNGEADHLIAAVSEIEREGCRVIGIGIGEDFVSRIYRSAIVVSNFRQMAEALLDMLAEQFGVRGLSSDLAPVSAGARMGHSG